MSRFQFKLRTPMVATVMVALIIGMFAALRGIKVHPLRNGLFLHAEALVAWLLCLLLLDRGAPRSSPPVTPVKNDELAGLPDELIE